MERSEDKEEFSNQYVKEKAGQTKSRELKRNRERKTIRLQRLVLPGPTKPS